MWGGRRAPVTFVLVKFSVPPISWPTGVTERGGTDVTGLEQRVVFGVDGTKPSINRLELVATLAAVGPRSVSILDQKQIDIFEKCEDIRDELVDSLFVTHVELFCVIGNEAAVRNPPIGLVDSLTEIKKENTSYLSSCPMR